MENFRASDENIEQKSSDQEFAKQQEIEPSQEQKNYMHNMQKFAEHFLKEREINDFSVEVFLAEIFDLESPVVLHEPRIAFKKDGKIIDSLIFAPDKYNNIKDLEKDFDLGFAEFETGQTRDAEPAQKSSEN